MKIFAMSDIHGHMDIVEENVKKIGFPSSPSDVLVLCGDYLDHSWENDVCDFAEVMDFQSRYPDGQVVCLAGNHEIDWMMACGGAPYAKAMARWVSSLPLYYETDSQIFVHAGIDEEAGDLWRVGTPSEWFTHCFPPQTGKWDDGEDTKPRSKDIVAGHVSTMNESLGGRGWGRCVYWDGENHFYLDGACEQSGVIPVLEYDCDSKTYFAWDEEGSRYPIADRR